MSCQPRILKELVSSRHTSHDHPNKDLKLTFNEKLVLLFAVPTATPAFNIDYDSRDGKELAKCPTQIPLTSYINTYLAIASSEKGGLGIFATIDIPADTLVLGESPLLQCQAHDFEQSFSKLDTLAKKAFEELSVFSGLNTSHQKARFLTNR